MSESLAVVEVVFALPDEQYLVIVPFREGLRVADAIRQSNIAALCPDYDLSTMKIAIWGRVASVNDRLREGDRVEILRPLLIDPRIARRERASAGQTMDAASAENLQQPDKGQN